MLSAHLDLFCGKKSVKCYDWETENHLLTMFLANFLKKYHFFLDSIDKCRTFAVY